MIYGRESGGLSRLKLQYKLTRSSWSCTLIPYDLIEAKRCRLVRIAFLVKHPSIFHLYKHDMWKLEIAEKIFCVLIIVRVIQISILHSVHSGKCAKGTSTPWRMGGEFECANYCSLFLAEEQANLFICGTFCLPKLEMPQMLNECQLD